MLPLLIYNRLWFGKRLSCIYFDMPVNGNRLNFNVMITDSYVPWDYYPRQLLHKQVQNPLSVIKEFFSIAKLKDRQLSLREWRDFVINDEYYADDKFGPGPLLFTYEWNIKLLEAMYLLSLDTENLKPAKPITEEDLAWEECSWLEYPDNLSEEERIDPFLAIENVFEEAMLPRYRDILWEWLEEALSKGSAFDEMSAINIVPVYDNLLRLYSAAWVIQMRIEDAEDELNAVNNKDNIGAEQEAGDNDHHQAGDGPTAISQDKPITTTLTHAGRLGIDALIAVILKAAPFVEAVYYMGTHGHPFTYYLLILISDDEKTPEHEVANKIEDHCRYLGLVYVLAHKTASAREGRAKGKLFWNNTLEETQCFYSKPGFEIGEYKKVGDKERIQLVTRSWERWGTQARGFQLGAETYLGDENYSLAAFMVHQAIESTFIAAINMELGYRLSSHNLSRMLKLTLLFTENFRDIFELNTNEGIAAFEALQTFYSNSRYKEDFNPDEHIVELLLPKVVLLLEKAEDIFKGFTYIPAAK